MYSLSCRFFFLFEYYQLLVLIMLHSIPRIPKSNVRWSLSQTFSKLQNRKRKTYDLFLLNYKSMEYHLFALLPFNVPQSWSQIFFRSRVVALHMFFFCFQIYHSIIFFGGIFVSCFHCVIQIIIASALSDGT